MNIDRQIVISLLNQVGGPVSKSEIKISAQIGEDFYRRWELYRERVNKELGSLNCEETKFLFDIMLVIVGKLDWETSTVTGYSQEQIELTLSNIRNNLKINCKELKNSNYIPNEFK